MTGNIHASTQEELAALLEQKKQEYEAAQREQRSYEELHSIYNDIKEIQLAMVEKTISEEMDEPGANKDDS